MGSVFDLFMGMSGDGGHALHNVRLEALRQEDGAIAMEVMCSGEPGVLRLCGGWGDWLQRDIGRMGYIAPAPTVDGSCYFRAYLDQTLRRVPELDSLDPSASDGQAPNVIGWWSAHRPEGFRAPVGLVPGERGGFIPDRTEQVAVRVPPEFTALCRQFGLTPEGMLRAFIADACDLSSPDACPRADGFQRSGSDEAAMARGWVERAFEHQRVAHSDELDPDHAGRVEEFDDLLLELQDLGGEAEDLMQRVRDLCDAKRGEVGDT